jgi:hypothetical protein
MQKYFVIVFLAGGLWFAKTRYYDPPRPRVRTQVEVIAETFGQYKRGKVTAGQLAAIAPATDSASPASILESLQSIVGANKTPAEKAASRFEKFMKSWQNGGVSESDEAQAAACIWARGSRALSANETNDAGTFFDLWRKEKGLYVESIRYDIRHVTPAPAGDYSIAVVSINGTEYQMGVPHTGNPIFWIR